MVGPKPFGPMRKRGLEAGHEIAPAFEFDGVALAVVEADRFHRGVARERPSETGRRILSAGKEHQCAVNFAHAQYSLEIRRDIGGMRREVQWAKTLGPNAQELTL